MLGRGGKRDVQTGAAATSAVTDAAASLTSPNGWILFPWARVISWFTLARPHLFFARSSADHNGIRPKARHSFFSCRAAPLFYLHLDEKGRKKKKTAE